MGGMLIDDFYTWKEINRNMARFRAGDVVLVPEGFVDGTETARQAVIVRILPHLVKLRDPAGFEFTLNYADCMKLKILKPVAEIRDDLMDDIAVAMESDGGKEKLRERAVPGADPA